MSNKIVLTLKNGKVFSGDTYRYNDFTQRFKLLNFVSGIEINPEENSLRKGSGCRKTLNR